MTHTPENPVDVPLALRTEVREDAYVYFLREDFDPTLVTDHHVAIIESFLGEGFGFGQNEVGGPVFFRFPKTIELRVAGAVMEFLAAEALVNLKLVDAFRFADEPTKSQPALPDVARSSEYLTLGQQLGFLDQVLEAPEIVHIREELSRRFLYTLEPGYQKGDFALDLDEGLEMAIGYDEMYFRERYPHGLRDSKRLKPSLFIGDEVTFEMKNREYRAKIYNIQIQNDPEGELSYNPECVMVQLIEPSHLEGKQIFPINPVVLTKVRA